MIYKNSKYQDKFEGSLQYTALIAASVASIMLYTLAAMAQNTGPRAEMSRSIFRGAKAIRVLGDKLPKVARAHNIAAKELRKTLRKDKSLALGPDLKLFYTCDALPEAGAEAVTSDMMAEYTTGYSLADTFKMHSKPGAKRIIHLDFDGHYLTNTAWNSYYNNGEPIDAPAWNIEGDAATFTDTERTAIQQIWARVAEDYAAFDVDVTTELVSEDAITRSSSSDEYYGTRALISPISYLYGNAGGVAYVNIFSSTSDFYKPALIFPEKLSNGVKYIAEAISHEVGHNLGLSHDGFDDDTTTIAYYQGHGSGETGWAPIMGNSYYKNLTQWSRGEYPYANNTQDDIKLINGHIPYTTDDHGDSTNSATVLPLASSFGAFGIINSASDIDVFKFNAGDGTVSIDVTPASFGPDVDLLVEIHDAQGRLLAVANPETLLSSSLDLSVTAGTYFLSVKGVGKGDLATGYSDYASIGQYTLIGLISNPNGDYPPVALANASTTSGDAPLAISFSGSQSSDVDGTIVAYKWDFGDGTSSFAADVEHVYNSPGIFTAMLTVTDNSGLTGSASLQIESFAPNQPPLADLQVSATNGNVPLTVTFDASNSIDSDGNIVSYAWNFGDGSSSNSTIATTSHTYSKTGTFTATVTITDNRGALSSDSVTISVTQNPALIVKVAAIDLQVIAAGKPVKNDQAKPTTSSTIVAAAIVITDLSGTPIQGATVTATWSGLIRGDATAVSDSTGTAALVSKAIRKSGTVTLAISSINAPGYNYDSSQNEISTASIVIP